MTHGQRGVGAVITALDVLSAFGRGAEALVSAALAGKPAFAPIERFDVSSRRVRVAATTDGAPDLRAELVRLVRGVTAGLTAAERATTMLLLAAHAHPDLARSVPGDRGGLPTVEHLAAEVALSCGLAPSVRAYTSACVASTSAVADAAAMVARGQADRVVVAAGYLVESDQFALFDAGRALATDGQVRPFSRQRKGLLLGDGVGAILVESTAGAAARQTPVLARLIGWGRAGDAYHVCQPRPDGAGLARAIAAALDRARVVPTDVGYVNAHGSGTAFSDAAEAAALARALGRHAAAVPVSSTKAVHGQALEASGLLELIVTVAALADGALPVNAGFVEPDPDCPLNLVLGPSRPQPFEFALSLNCAFGGANTALLLGAAC